MRIYLLCLLSYFWFVQLSVYSQSQAIIPHSQLEDADQKIPYRIKKKQWIEDVSKRTEFSSSFKKADGGIVYYVSKEPVNFRNSAGEWQAINTELVPFQNGWKTSSLAIDHKISTNGEILFSCESKNKLSIGAQVKINGVTSGKGTTIIHGDTAYFNSILSGVDKEIICGPKHIKYNYIFNNANAIPASGIVIKEKIDFSVPFQLAATPEFSEINKDGTIKGHLSATDNSGNNLFNFGTIMCYDANGDYVVGNYSIEKENGATYLLMHVPASWVNSTNRVFPIVVDPLVTGPTATWAGGVIPSCFTPNYRSDSILVTIPAGITVTNLSVSGNYYADPFTTSVMADGKMFFSTSCNSSQIFTITIANGGNTPGTAYLDNFNLRNPLLCCLPQSCSQQTFYLTYNLQRTTNGSTCNSTYVYYTPTSPWPFSAYIEGYTPESYSSNMYFNPATLCSNDCDFIATMYARYGVPPYTFSHPWSTQTTTVGTAQGCSNGNEIEQLTLINPNCPVYCDTTTSTTVPPPSIVDACGNAISGWPTFTLNLKPTPQVNLNPDSLVVCPKETVTIATSSCLAGSSIYWSGNNQNGTGNIVDSLLSNTSTNYQTFAYSVWAELNGCYSDTLLAQVTVEPELQADFTVSSPSFVGQETFFTDVTNTSATINGWNWNFANGTNSNLQNSSTTYTDPGDYLVCLSIISTSNCVDTVCKTVSLLPLEIIPPNVFSPNGDGINDVLEFPYLEFYPSNHLSVFNRWGQLLYEKDNYTNDWNGESYPDGVYYFVLLVLDKEYTGFFHLFRHK